MIALQQITKLYDNHTVLDDVDLSLNSGEVLALIGENGAGKTTLLKVLLGEVKPTAGKIQLHHETVGYVAQEAASDTTVIASFAPSMEPWRVDWALSRVGLQSSEDLLVTQLSGGQRTRLSLAHILAQDPEPTVLLLDEPTNNLDSDGLVWLAQFIRSFRGGVILVSHDRAFIDQVATGVLELTAGKLKRYGGNYTFYRQQKQAESEAELAAYEHSVDEQRRVETMLRAAKDRARVGTTNRQPPDNDKFARGFFNNRVQGKFSARAKSLESRLAQLEKISKPEAARQYRMDLAGDVPKGKLLLELAHVSKSFAGTPVLADVSCTLYGSQRIHVRGHNGGGKTTLLQIAAGLLQPDEGKVTIGPNVRIGYLSQQTDGLDYTQCALDNLVAVNHDVTAVYSRARSIGLNEADLRKKPGELSRGQQTKVAFAKLLFAGNHLLILDEPTNHLDIPTRQQLERALQNYSGALLVASHDAYFVNDLEITTQVDL